MFEIKKIMNEEFRNKMEKSFDDFANRTLEVVLQAINQKQVEVDYWRKKALTFSKKFKVCLECGSRKNYSLESMKCKNCLEYE